MTNFPMSFELKFP